MTAMRFDASSARKRRRVTAVEILFDFCVGLIVFAAVGVASAQPMLAMIVGAVVCATAFYHDIFDRCIMMLTSIKRWADPSPQHITCFDVWLVRMWRAAPRPRRKKR